MARKVDIRFSASMEIDKLMQSLSDVKKGMADVKIPANVAKGLNNALSDAEYSMKELQKMGEQPIMTRSALKQFNKVYKQATEDYKNVFRYINQLQNADVKFNAKESLGKQYKYYQLIEQTIKKITDSQKKTTENYQERERALEKYKTELSEIKKIQDKLTKADENSKKAKLDLQNAQDKYNSSLVRNGPGPESDRIAKLRDKINDAEKESEAAENTLNRIQEQAKEKTGGESIESVITRLSAAVEQGQKSLDSISNGTAGFVEQLNNLKRATEEDSGLKDFFDNQELTGLQNGLEDITNLSDLKDLMVAVRQNAEELAQVDFSNMTESLPQVEHSLDNIEEEADRTNIQVRELIDTTEDFGKVGQRALDFFALSNLGNIFGQIVSDAKKAISDLDEVMTATAVVTNFSVGDMWDKLPEYTRLANELGASTLGAYETTTLFYQQGLNTNQAMEIGAETMRMARIAGLDYAKATDYMTASLRGFNMELSAESAEHINDVFSNLAAKTASNQQEMAEALTKTASIANSAGMSFETTSVLLAKMIETTRESPENLGTALKTVIGRFAEMKKATSDLITTEDGEVISVNRVDSALKSVGIQLKDASGKFRSLDDVFLELSQRWDTLDIMSQRYIATQAAGSRQQSRFIAMMENYTRTQELLGYAYNSSGAAAEQFNKTMESMEAKMARLNNSWNTFVTGIVNASALKTGVDLLNGILTVINDITNVMPGALNGISKMLLGFLGIRTIKPLLTGVLFDVNKFIQESIAGKGASEFSKGLKAGFTGLRNTVFNRETWYKSGLEAGAAAADGIQTSIQSPAWVSAQSKSGQKLIQRFLNLDGTEDASKVINKLGKSFNATEEQITLFNQAIENGVPKEDALLILRNKEVVSNYTAANSTGVFNAAVLANTIAEEENTIATASATRAKELENAAEKNGILQKGAALVKILFMSKAKREEAAVTLGLAHAEGDAAVATGALGKGLMALPLGTVALGLTTILVAFHALNKNLHSAEWEKVENAKKTLESVDARQEESDKIKELNSSYENARDSYNDTTKAKREYINATQELAQAIGAEIKANDLLSGNTKKINTQIKKGQTERTRNSIKQIEAEIEAAQTLIKNGEYVKRTYGGQFFLGDFSRTLWGRQSYAEADEQVTQGQESLEKSKADLKEEQIQLALLQAQSKNNINIAATSYSQFAAFKTDFTNQLTEFGLTQNEIASSLRQILTDSEVEFNLINEAERQFTERLAKSEIGIDKTELEEFYKSIRDEDINTLEYVSLVGVNDINDLKKQYDNAKTLYDS
ncbi:MAG: phage tail tape measure protein, partial [Candidatus Riflebacteria bacterium]|nr:phage tail tape measure protein [Candidatus Riflebacteria bacterium]